MAAGSVAGNGVEAEPCSETSIVREEQERQGVLSFKRLVARWPMAEILSISILSRNVS